MLWLCWGPMLAGWLLGLIRPFVAALSSLCRCRTPYLSPLEFVRWVSCLVGSRCRYWSAAGGVFSAGWLWAVLRGCSHRLGTAGTRPILQTSCARLRVWGGVQRCVWHPYWSHGTAILPDFGHARVAAVSGHAELTARCHRVSAHSAWLRRGVADSACGVSRSHRPLWPFGDVAARLLLVPEFTHVRCGGFECAAFWSRPFGFTARGCWAQSFVRFGIMATRRVVLMA